MNAMVRGSAYKGVKPAAVKRRGPISTKPRKGNGAAPAKVSRSTRYRRILAEMDAQIAQIKATLDAAERMMDEIEAG